MKKKEKSFNDRSLYIYQEKKLFAWKNTIHSSQYNFRFMPFFFLSIYECISAFSFFLKAEREGERKKAFCRVFTIICYIHRRKKNILCIYEDQFHHRWMIIETDTSTCSIDCLMLRRRRNVRGGEDTYTNEMTFTIYTFILFLIVIKYTRTISSHLERNSSNWILNGYPFFRISHIWSTPE
jgi:hypothetical protein